VCHVPDLSAEVNTQFCGYVFIHNHFGAGKFEDIAPGVDYIVTVKFMTVGMKDLSAKSAPLDTSVICYT
jgi:hypothetical protein